jgi:hypothetical protein
MTWLTPPRQGRRQARGDGVRRDHRDTAAGARTRQHERRDRLVRPGRADVDAYRQSKRLAVRAAWDFMNMASIPARGIIEC